MTKRKAESGAKSGAKRQSPAKSKVKVTKTAPKDTGAAKVDASATGTGATAASETSPVLTPHTGASAGSPAAASAPATPQSAGLKRWAIPGAIAAGLAGAGLWYSLSGPDPSTSTETTAISGITQDDNVQTTASAVGAAPGQTVGEPASPQTVTGSTGPESGEAVSDPAQIAKTPEVDASRDAAPSELKSATAPVTESASAARPKASGPSAGAGAATATTIDAAYNDQWGRVMTQAMNPVTYFQMMAAMTQGAMNAANASAEPADTANKANK